MENTIYWVWLSRISELTVTEKRKLLKKYDISRLWNISKSEAIYILKNEEKADALIDKRYKTDLQKHLEYMKLNDINLISICDEKYPKSLKHIYDSPVVLYTKGNIDILNNLSIAIVGSRNASEYGKKIAKTMSYMLAKNNINVISGLARGIDANAHIGAINANGITVAIVANGLDKIYPMENEYLYREIIQKNGVIITEYALGTRPLSINFPARNRIISGLSNGVLVVEASRKSGSLITADFALEQGKNVYAVPGNITSPNSIGTNELIKQGAKLITNVGEIIEDYNFL